MINCQVVIPVVLVNRKLPLIPPPVIDPSTCKQKIHLIIHRPPPRDIVDMDSIFCDVLIYHFKKYFDQHC